MSHSKTGKLIVSKKDLLQQPPWLRKEYVRYIDKIGGQNIK